MTPAPVTIPDESIVYTGGSGLLGRELRLHLPRARFPARSQFDVTSPDAMDAFVESLVAANPGAPLRTIVHGAAFTSPPKVDQDPGKALDANIVGTANVVRLAQKWRLRVVYISTDYVFRGDRGHYSETDTVDPVNKYAWSKLGGECAVRDRKSVV